MDPDDDPTIECFFFVPVVRNSDGAPHRPLAWFALDDALYTAFQGTTGPELLYIAIRPVEGQYRSAARGSVIRAGVTSPPFRRAGWVSSARCSDARRTPSTRSASTSRCEASSSSSWPDPRTGA